jgi:hypothetical protein
MHACIPGRLAQHPWLTWATAALLLFVCRHVVHVKVHPYYITCWPGPYKGLDSAQGSRRLEKVQASVASWSRLLIPAAVTAQLAAEGILKILEDEWGQGCIFLTLTLKSYCMLVLQPSRSCKLTAVSGQAVLPAAINRNCCHACIMLHFDL